MRVMITGAAGFIGRALTAALLATGKLIDGPGISRDIDELVLVDRSFQGIQRRFANEAGIVVNMEGDLSDEHFAEEVASITADVVFHLAASLTLDAEQHSDEAYHVNVEVIRRFIKKASSGTRFLFASSIAVFGGDLPPVVTDLERFSPQTSYGAHKAIAELLLADATRRNRIDARILRLPIVIIRDGANNPAVSDQIAAIVREPLSGRDIDCALSRHTQIPVASANAVAKALIQLSGVPSDELPPSRALNFPSLAVTVDQMIDSTIRQAGSSRLGAVRFVPDERTQRIVDGWPRDFVSIFADRLGIYGDGSMDDIVFEYLSERGSRQGDAEADKCSQKI